MAEAVFLRPWENRVCLLGGTELSLLPPCPGPAPPPVEGPDSSGGPLVAGGAALVWPSVERLQVEVIRPSLLLNSILSLPPGLPGLGGSHFKVPHCMASGKLHLHLNVDGGGVSPS